MKPPSLLLTIAVISVVCAAGQLHGQPPSGDQPDRLATDFATDVQPVLKQFCFDCHGTDTQESGIRLDRLDGKLDDKQLRLLKHMLGQINKGTMPPKGEPQLNASQKAAISEWTERSLLAGKKLLRPKNGSARRLTVEQYQNTLRDLLGIQDQLSELLPADGVSTEGFRNNADTLLLTPQMMETYFEIADRALDICLVDENAKPEIQCVRVEFGANVNKHPVPEDVRLNGPRLLPKQQYLIEEVVPDKSFDFEPRAMQKKFRFIEGYIGNGTVREWKDFEGLNHSVFAALIGQHTGGYNYGRATAMVPEGLLMRPRTPETTGNGSAPGRGPAPTLSLPIRELPTSGILQVTVEAARYNDGYQPTTVAPTTDDRIDLDIAEGKTATLEVPSAAVYQFDVVLNGPPNDDVMIMDVGMRTFSKRVKGKFEPDPDGNVVIPLLVARCENFDAKIKVRNGDGKHLKALRVTRIADDSESGRNFAAFEKTVPHLSVHMGVRTDVGARLSRFAEPKAVPSTNLERYSFRAPLSGFSLHDTAEDNANYLAGLSEIAVRSEPTDNRQIPRVLVRAVQVEGPYYDSWPPQSHRDIFFASENESDPFAHALEILERFATRAYRRPPVAPELAALLEVWLTTYDETQDFQLGIRNALLVALTSPQFLFITEESETPAAEPLMPHETAAKLSYLLWNSMPDERLRSLAKDGTINDKLSTEIERMIADERFDQFTEAFVSQWLSLDKFDVVNVNLRHYPRLNRETRRELRKEPIEFVNFLIRNNLPLRNLVDPDFIVANEVTAGYYGLGDRARDGYRFVPIQHQSDSLGGVLTQAAILAGLSDGSESNPVKRGAWVARKIVAEPPDPPPPNVPELVADENASLRERLEMHRNQKGCAACHQKIDPWGLPLEQFDAGGLLKKEEVDSNSTLPDGHSVANIGEFKRYLGNDRVDQVAYSYLMHLASYATGRTLSYNEQEYLRSESRTQLKANGYRMLDCVKFVVESPIFMEK